MKSMQKRSGVSMRKFKVNVPFQFYLFILIPYMIKYVKNIDSIQNIFNFATLLNLQHCLVLL